MSLVNNRSVSISVCLFATCAISAVSQAQQNENEVAQSKGVLERDYNEAVRQVSAMIRQNSILEAIPCDFEVTDTFFSSDSDDQNLRSAVVKKISYSQTMKQRFNLHCSVDVSGEGDGLGTHLAFLQPFRLLGDGRRIMYINSLNNNATVDTFVSENPNRDSTNSLVWRAESFARQEVVNWAYGMVPSRTTEFAVVEPVSDEEAKRGIRKLRQAIRTSPDLNSAPGIGVVYTYVKGTNPLPSRIDYFPFVFHDRVAKSTEYHDVVEILSGV